MNDHSQKEPYRYHWNYGEQVAYDRDRDAKHRRRGLRSYAIAMTAMFLACILVLVGVVIWHGRGSDGNVAAVAAEVSPATVLIYSTNGARASYGTGFFLSSDGYIATNEHVVADAREIIVTLYTGEQFEATYIGGSEIDDLAVLKVDGVGFSTLRIGDSSSLRAGDVAVAVGNPAGAEAAWTVTKGIISAPNRTLAVSGYGYSAYIKMIQTDAPLNPGNSGGPLCNANGEVIGVISRKMIDYEGISFAIPINEAMQTLNAIIDGTFDQAASTVSTYTVALGISGEDIKKGASVKVGTRTYKVDQNGIHVTAVDESGCAYGFLQTGDVIYAIDGTTFSSGDELRELFEKYRIGDTVTVKVERQNTHIVVQIQFGP
ncbi:MAG: trypsin-like peptidase domain-containing protein [Clostridia bacterium]|nr:trypsin-like peptidase domain-containing protein [Clostridia bacterium]